MNSRLVISVFALVSLLGGCASSAERGPIVGSASSEPRGFVPSGLDDYLARLPGVTVNGSGPRARIHVSGADYPNPPLFVVDGLAIGYDFSAAWSRAPAHDIESVQVIRANDTAAARYGARGGNGVIEIMLKRGEPSR
jgi:outer membrane cobalamin receptor